MIRDLVIDGDHIAFNVSESKSYKNGFDADADMDNDEAWETGVALDTDMTIYQEHFKSIVADYVCEAEVEGIIQGWTVGKVMVVMSDETNFRYEVYPPYKAKRPSNSEVRGKLRAWAREHYTCEPNTEADDVVAYYVRNGALGVTTDKDLFKGVGGIWFNSHFMHRKWLNCTPEEGEYFFKCQILAGDGVDGIPSIDGVGIITANKLMKKHGSSYQDILQIFKDKGHDKKYMVTMARLVSMTQWTPKKGIKLWKLPK